jgi:probable rRNA maturation factor
MDVNPRIQPTVDLDLQIASATHNLPSADDFSLWVSTALSNHRTSASLTIRLVDNPESQQLNSDYRNLDKPTNVLSFPFEAPPGINDADILALLGDLIICAPVVEQEAIDQDKPLLHHWAHMVVHGTLHLLGYDHIDDAEAQSMEYLERQILNRLNIADPYWIADDLPTGNTPL